MAEVWHHIAFHQRRNVDIWYQHVLNEGVYSISAIKHALYGLASVLPFAAMYANNDGDFDTASACVVGKKLANTRATEAVHCTAEAQRTPGRRNRVNYNLLK